MKKKREKGLAKNFLEDGSNRALKMYVRREVSVSMCHISTCPQSEAEKVP